MRSGWDNASTVITTRTGPHSNHYHFDQGSFQIMTNGEELLTDPGIGTGGYYMNTEFLSYNTQSIAHNVLLVDHDPGSQIAAHFDNGLRSLSDWPTMSAPFNGQSVDAVTASLATVYKGKLDSYERKLVYRKNGPVFLWDRVTARKDETHVYDWLFHVPQMQPQRTCSYENNRFLLEQPKARLTIDFVYPSGLAASIRDRNGNTSSYLNYNSKTFSESFLTLSTVKALPAADFLAVMMPEPLTGTPLAPLPATESLSGEGWIGARCKRGDEEDIAYCRTGADRQQPLNGLQTDARFLLLSKTADAQTCFFEGKQLQTDHWHLVADKDVSLAATSRANSRQIEVETKAPATLRVEISGKLLAVRVNGKAVKTTVKDGWLTIPAAAGKTTVNYETK
ncbi:MAG: heparinase II/III family protein [Flavihumibacter sp.]